MIPSRAELDEFLSTFEYRNPTVGLRMTNFTYAIDVEGVAGRVSCYVTAEDSLTGEPWGAWFELPMELGYSAQDQFRRLIRSTACHESDERIWVGSERPYNQPH